MNKSLADKAVEAITAPGFEKGDGYCQRWIRQVVQAVYGAKYNAYHLSSAKKAGEAWRRDGFSVEPMPPVSKLEPGDICYKLTGSGGFGHVAIWTPRGFAENSSFHGTRDARGFRTPRQFGAYQVVVRLPDPAKVVETVKPVAVPKPTEPPQLVLNAAKAPTCKCAMIGNELWVPARPLIEALGHTITGVNNSIESRQRFYLNTD